MTRTFGRPRRQHSRPNIDIDVKLAIIAYQMPLAQQFPMFDQLSGEGLFALRLAVVEEWMRAELKKEYYSQISDKAFATFSLAQDCF